MPPYPWKRDLLATLKLEAPSSDSPDPEAIGWYEKRVVPLSCSGYE